MAEAPHLDKLFVKSVLIPYLSQVFTGLTER